MASFKPRRAILYILFRLVSTFIFLLPLKIALKIGEFFGRICFYILGRERTRALENLDIAFDKSKTSEEKNLIARLVFENLGKSLVEVVSISKFNRTNIDTYIECKSFRVLDSFIDQRKPVIILSGHFGNWELMAHYFGIKGYRVNVVARRVREEGFERFLGKIRKRNNLNVLYRDTSFRDILAFLKHNEFIGIMPDQDIDSLRGVFVDFFGRSAYTPSGPAILNFLTGASIVPCFIVRKDWGHEVIVQEPLRLSSTGDRDKDILENTEILTKAIESYVRRFPTQWVWFHQRWKTRPENK